ncbi:geranylgeranyl pyrophosphate synthase [Orenia metallireducens]|uniref:Geranylgeranyl pyrophosphate synthase n=1 Tax=Orenia metallireducens TaxID=1413210 RepID=A0A1C0A6Z2_9FIRM|nr:polyprenyl synthetase family protein [Orenia metallireducens]OCL26035.1 geranylgeranyl pyrophosphate synthase [Orenia metallireducens]
MFWDRFPLIKEEVVQFEDYLQGTLVSRQPLIQEAISDLAKSGGKRIRPALLMLTAKFGEYKREEVWSLAAALEILHMATLIHDDIIDDANLRRGSETVQSKYGKDVAVFAGDYLFTLTFDILAGEATNEQLKQVSNIIKQICEGEIQQHQDRYNIDVTYKGYFKRVKSKTALLFEGSCALGAGSAGLPKATVRNLGHYGRYIGMAFQLVDDLFDFTKSSSSIGKPKGNDFTQGIYTLPILYTLYESSYGEKLAELLDNPLENNQEIKDIITNNGSLDYTMKVAKTYINKAKKKIKGLAGNPYHQILIDLADIVVNRDY